MFTVSASTPADSVLRDLVADTWFQAQHDVVAITAPLVTAPRHRAHPSDLWDGPDSDVHAFLALHPAF